uniref:Uncharacterized protein n=1 Tax=Brassica oleracea TaxID=3712 RepID=A0A3P6DZJ4_BRAOL|nr:unnamed protein product [Brassica oleracea]
MKHSRQQWLRNGKIGFHVVQGYSGRWVVSNWIGVHIRVPKVAPAPHTVSAVGDAAEEASAQKKHVSLQRQAAVTVEVLRITLGGLNLVSMSFPLTIRLVKSWLSPA